eukprot:73371-Prymnesium_polylepis.1
MAEVAEVAGWDGWGEERVRRARGCLDWGGKRQEVEERRKEGRADESFKSLAGVSKCPPTWHNPQTKRPAH